MRLFRARRRLVAVRAPPASWLAWPTLSSANGTQIKTAGVHYRRDALAKAIAQFGDLVMAELKVEQGGQYAGAVRVNVGGLELGSIPHGVAEDWRLVVEQLDQIGQPATCRAVLEYEPGEAGCVDVWLYGNAEASDDTEPFLPAIRQHEVSLDHGQADALGAALHSKAKTKTQIMVGEVREDDGTWIVTLEGERIGACEPDEVSRVVTARTAGFPLTCRIRVRRSPDRPLYVAAELPPD